MILRSRREQLLRLLKDRRSLTPKEIRESLYPRSSVSPCAFFAPRLEYASLRGAHALLNLLNRVVCPYMLGSLAGY